MGISTAYWLARGGTPVVLLEAHLLAGGASGRNAGLMLPGSHPLEDPDRIQTILHEEAIDAGYTIPGHLALASSGAVWDRICQEANRRQHTATPVYAIDRAACEDLLGMRVNTRFFGGRWWPHGGLIHPTRYVYGLAGAALRHGASLLTHTEVLGIEAIAGQDRFVIHTTRGTLSTRHIVFACHTRLCEFAPGFRKVISPVRGQVLSTEPLPCLFNIGLAVDWGTVYWRQASDGVIVLGGYRNRAPQTEMSNQACVNSHIQEALSLFLPDTFLDFPSFRVDKRWAGIMDQTLDDDPLIGAMPHIPNQWIIAGFGGHGLPASLGAGQALAEAITTGQTPTAIEPFAPERFTKDIP